MLDKNKCDPILGEKVHKHLLSVGVETPRAEGARVYNTSRMKDIEAISDEKKKLVIQRAVQTIMLALGLDMEDDSLKDTPNRVAKMYVDEIFWGLLPEYFPKATTVDNKMHYGSMVVEKDITVMSSCEHHLVTIDGIAHVAYIPKQKVLGLSKINRIVEYFSRRPQIQERLTEQVFHALCVILETDDVAVWVDAKHYCVKSRGVGDQNSHTVTNKLGGAFMINATTRNEFVSMCSR